jgi:flagellar assembly protein FliH
MMNLLSEPQVEAQAPLLPTSDASSASARLEYRALGDEELEMSFPRTGDRRRIERRTVPQSLAAIRALSDDEWREAVKAARAEGFALGERDGRGKARADMESELRTTVSGEHERIADALGSFAESKGRYFAEIEGQVVRLALAIAARVLHRETQMDALVLSGAVRVALDKLAERSGVVLRAAESDVKAWETMFAGMEMVDTPRVIGDSKMARGDCVLETTMGTVELGVSTQLEEIERGFFDLLSLNPAVRA